MRSVFRTLVINPGINYTKIGVFNNEVCIFEKSIQHHVADLSNYRDIIKQHTSVA